MHPPSSEAFRLSPVQRRLWDLRQDSAESGALFVFRLDGAVDTTRLRQALGLLVQEHEILRTRFILPAGMKAPVQEVAAARGVELTEEDLRGHAEAARAQRVAEMGRELRARAAVFAVLSPLPAKLVQIEDRAQLLLLALPSLCADAETGAILLRDLCRGYGGTDRTEEEAPLQYPDISEWLHELQTESEGSEGVQSFAFFRQLDCSGMAAQRPPLGRPASVRGSTSVQRRSLPVALVGRIDAVAGQLGTSCETIILAGWLTLLMRLGGQERLILGMASSLREFAELKEAPGPLSCYLPLCVSGESDRTFREFVRWLDATKQGLVEHQRHFSFGLLALPEGQDRYSFLFEYRESPTAQHVGRLRLTLAEAEVSAEPSRLRLAVVRTGDEVSLRICFDAASLTPEAVALLAEQLEAALAEAADHPERMIAALSLTSERTQARLDAWESGAAVAIPPLCAHQLFEAQADTTPDSIAVMALPGREQLTYRELALRANQLAHALIERGVGPDVLVGICLPRSIDLLVALLGVLKAGGAYVPLDASLPQARIQLMLADAQPRLLITTHALATAQLAGTDRLDSAPHILCVDSEREALAGRPSAAVASRVGPQDLAYCIYTSGSTGVPKGTLIEHRGLTNYLAWAVRAYDVVAGSGAPVNTSIGFDATITSLLCPLLAGGKVTLLPEQGEAEALAAALESGEPYSLVKLTPSHLLLLEKLVSRPIAARCFVVGGEALEERHLAFLRTHAPSARIINEYGPTETVVGCCVQDASARRDEGPIPIGRPIANTRLVVKSSASPAVRAAIGEEGELYIGGAGVARGYLRRPELTAARFGAADAGEGRMYRTGDRVRWRADGSLEFLGRRDEQVKLRGHRIELGEIEATLRQHPAVREAVVILQEEPADHKQLAAYVTLSAGLQSRTAAALRQYLHERLPAPWVPASLQIVDALPLTANGKIDRQKIAGWTSRPLLAGYAPPETPIEEVLAEIWADVLKRERVGVHDRFYDLGGDSLLSVQIVARTRAAGIHVELQQLLQLQTIHALARTAGGDVAPGPKVEPLALVPGADRPHLPPDVEDAYPLAAVQLAMLFFSQYHAGSHVYHNISRFRLQAPFDGRAWEEALHGALAHHPILRTSFHLGGFSTPLQLVHRTVPLPLAVTDLRPLSNEAQAAAYERFLNAERGRSFSWEQAPLLRVHLHRLSEERTDLTLTLHHALLDGWSHAFFVTELLTDYAGRLRGVPPVRSSAAVTYRDFIALEQAAARSETARSFWHDLLSDATVQSLPRWPDSFRPQEQSDGPPAEGMINIPIPQAVTDGLRALARLAGATLKSVVLAAHARVLGFLCNQQDVVTGLIGHGRPEELGAEQVLGNYLNVLPMRLQLEGGAWIELVRQALAAEQRAMPFRRYPMANIQRELGGRPLFETALNFSHFHVAEGAEKLESVRVLSVDDWAAGEMRLQVNATLNGQQGSLGLQLTYDPNGLHRRQVELIAGYYGRTLAAMAGSPNARYQEFSPLSDAERQEMLQAWNSHACDYPRAVLVHHLIEAQAARKPEAVALVAYDETTPVRVRAAAEYRSPAEAAEPRPTVLTYGALDRRANQLAHELRALGSGPGCLVGICLERSVEMGVAVLGVLKSGAAYVPLDPSYPEDRLGYMLDHAEVQVVLTSRRMLQRLLVLAGAQRTTRAVVLLDADEPVWRRPETPVESRGAPEHLAYCIYTSGSTGRPKGVMVTHGNWLNSFRMWEQTYRLEQLTCHLQMASFSFDVFPADFVRSLCSGARLVLCPREWLLDGEQLLGLMRIEQVDCAEFVPAVFRPFAQYLQDSRQKAAFLRLIAAGSDAWYLDEYWRWREVLGEETRLLNTYGLTEATVDSSYFETDDRARYSGSTITPIGKPFANVRIYLLDRWQMPVPIGTPGEIFIGGLGVSLGYINQPELTAERFLDDPFHRDGRMFRSGDMGRYLPDGTIEFIGRRDSQIKLRGFRIEIGEIEALLSQHPWIQQTAIIVDESRPGNARLLAYVALRGDGAAGQADRAATPETWAGAAQALRESLAAKLPDYMVPAAIVVLPHLPLTPNGKIDRRALPAPEQASPGEQKALTPPRTQTEGALAALWRQLLGIEQLGIDSHFAELGGHSLVAMQMAARVRGLWSIDLSLRSILEHPTIASLADHIDSVLLARQLQAQLPASDGELVDVVL